MLITGVNRENTIPKELPINSKVENVADLVGLSLFMDGTVKCKLPSTPPSTGSRIIQNIA
jgi:hypothetical protein